VSDLQLTRYANEGVAGDVLSHRPRALHDAGHGLSVGADAVAGRPRGGLGGIAEGGQPRRIQLVTLTVPLRDLWSRGARGQEDLA
jgi:hypothetical protein